MYTLAEFRDWRCPQRKARPHEETATEHLVATAMPPAGMPNECDCTLWATEEFLTLCATRYICPYMEILDVQLAVLFAIEKPAKESTEGPHNICLDAVSGPFLTQLWHLVCYDKNNGDKGNLENFLMWVRRCMRFRHLKLGSRRQMVRCGLATEQTLSEEDEQLWQENVELRADEVSECYGNFAQDFWRHDLTAEQKRNKRYMYSETQHGITNAQRSLLDVVLRIKLGNKKVALFIFQHGAPRMFLTPAHMLPREQLATEQRMRRRIEHLPEALAETLEWLTVLANNLKDDAAQHGPQKEHVLSQRRSERDPADEEELRRHRQRVAKVLHDIRIVTRLAAERDSGKRRFHDMDTDEQALLEEYDTGRLQKRKREYSHTRMAPFRGLAPGAASGSAGPGPFISQDRYQ